MKFHKKQKEVLKCIKYENPKILICSGAKRAGKTFVLIFGFMAHISKYKDEGLSFILGGATQASIRRKILDDIEKELNSIKPINKDISVDTDDEELTTNNTDTLEKDLFNLIDSMYVEGEEEDDD